jgi:hypothetical protein
MMLTFPSSPYHSGQRVFPSPAGRPVYQTVPSRRPRVLRDVRFAIRPSCTSLPIPSYPRSESRDAVRLCTTVQAAIAALPQGSSLRSGLCCPGPSSLIDPMRPTHRCTSISPIRLIRGALAVRRLAAPRQPVSGSVLSWTVLCRHVIVCDPGKLVGCTYPVPSPTTLAFDQDP